MNIEDLDQFLRITDSSLETAKLAINKISELHIKYCELFRNDIDNLWSENDGRRKMCGMFCEAQQPFRSLIKLEKDKIKRRKSAQTQS